MRRVWVLNLDADLELAAMPGIYAPTRGVREASRRIAPALAERLLAPGDVLIDDDAVPTPSARGLPGRAFCPTPRAIAALERAGAIPEPAPPASVLRRVNSRAFVAALGPTLPGATFVTTEDEARRVLAAPPLVGDDWRAKRAFGMSGRGQRIMRPGALSDADWGFLRACIAEEGVELEPNVDIETEYALHGMLERTGELTLGSLVRQRCDDVGAWLSTERVDEPVVAAALVPEAHRIAAALHGAGYFGPFGIDAFTYRAHGSLALRTCSEINARYTMGFSVGFGRG